MTLHEPVYCALCLKDGKQVKAKAKWYNDLMLCLLCLKRAPSEKEGTENQVESQLPCGVLHVSPATPGEADAPKGETPQGT